MRLSDAIALGRTLVVMDPSCYQRCLIGLGYRAIGKDPYIAWKANWTEYPWLREQCDNPPFHIGKDSYCEVIGALAHRVKDGKITIEQALDWIRSVEPTPSPDEALAEDCSSAEVCQKAVESVEE